MRARTVNITLGVVAAAVATGGWLTLRTPVTTVAAPLTATVSVGSITQTVSASGSVEAQEQSTVDFTSSGTITEIAVEVGQKVSTGDTLARIDPTNARNSYQIAQDNLVAATARLSTLNAGLTGNERVQLSLQTDQAKASVDAAIANFESTKATIDLNAQSLQIAIDQAEASLAATQAQLEASKTTYQASVDQASASLETEKAALANSYADLTQAKLDLEKYAPVRDAAQVKYDQLKASLASLKSEQSVCQKIGGAAWITANGTVCRDVGDQVTDMTNQVADATQALADAKANVTTATNASTSAENAVTSGKAKVTSATNAFNNALNSQKSNLLRDAQTLTTAQNQVNTARNNQRTNQLKDFQSLSTAQRQIDSAKTSLRSTQAGNAVKLAPAKASDVASARAQVTSARQAVIEAQKVLEETTLKAPTNGIVGSISKSVGDASSSSSSASAGGGSGNNAAGSVSSGFITLTDLDSLRIKTGFGEVDAAKIAADQTATITFDALPGQTFNGTVTSIDTASTIVSNVVTYYAYISIEDATDSIKPGMSATVEVTTLSKENILTVSAAAIQNGRRATLLKDGVQSRAVVEIGIQGSGLAEVVSGLADGDVVVIPTASATGLAGAARTAGAGGGFGGGAGGGLGGGAGGLGRGLGG
jgi:multidrug efflux pump subunit AcrA (membrane-fusion protein)